MYSPQNTSPFPIRPKSWSYILIYLMYLQKKRELDNIWPCMGFLHIWKFIPSFALFLDTCMSFDNLIKICPNVSLGKGDEHFKPSHPITAKIVFTLPYFVNIFVFLTIPGVIFLSQFNLTLHVPKGNSSTPQDFNPPQNRNSFFSNPITS